MRKFIGQVANLLMVAAIAFAFLFLLAFNLYCLNNSVNYSSVDIPFWVKLFEGFAAAGTLIFLAALMAKQFDIRMKIAAMLIAVSIFSAFNAYLYRANNVMMDYDDWLQQGMPARPLPWHKQFWAPVLP
jgi:hypothetical protein